jgi:hypothetical protein
MPLWGWIALVVVLSAIVIPIKLRILKKMLQKKDSTAEDNRQ